MPLVYNCPIIDCAWQHQDDGPAPLADGATDDDLHAQAVLHQATVEHALRAHYETHDTEAWVRTVSELHAELAARTVPLLCVGCLSDRHQAQQAGRALPPQNPAQVIVNGSGLCVGHLQFGPAPIPGRTPAGLIVGGA